ncbi:flagellar filament capping protein FliD [Paenibacillus sp. NPDC056579]|uniref:flagellar filament capping protein FliD n=1 Tax=Paenibacillus sp. NPDC056579 TaxID=3345871 RepID=UPI0036BC8C78
MPIRITGMSSGMDTEKIIKDLMKAERIPLDKLKQKKTAATWSTDLYREVNTKLASLRKSLNDMRFGNDFKEIKAASSNEAAVTATSTNGNVSSINRTIEVISLASNAVKSSTGTISNQNLEGTALAGSTNITAGVNDQLNITLNGVRKTITLTAKSYTPAELKDELQSKIDGAFGANRINVNLNTSKLSLTPTGTAGFLPQVTMEAAGANTGLAAIGFTDKQSYKLNINAELGANKFATTLTYGDFKINGQTISVNSTDKLSDVINKVNNSAAGVIMSYDEITDKITFTSKDTGVAAQVKLENGTSNFVSAMKMDTTVVTGKDAEVKIDGATTFRGSNTFTADGVTYTLKQTTTSPVTVNTTYDTDAVLNKIKDFVTKYNETIELLNKRVKETKYKSYSPLTDDQKADMSEDDIKLWEEKAKSGLLKNDITLSSTLRSMRSAIIDPVGSLSTTYNSLSKIGIDTVSYDANAQNDAGKLVINEEQLRKALSEDPNGVVSLFTNQGGSSDSNGIAQRLYDQANKGIGELITKAGGVGTIVNDITTELGLQIKNMEDGIDRLEDKLVSKENYYYKMFSAMEQAIEKSNAQMSYLSKIGG